MNESKAPNDNYEVAICETCGREFIKRKRKGTRQLAVGIRGRLSKNCSKRCTMLSKHKKTDEEKANEVKDANN